MIRALRRLAGAVLGILVLVTALLYLWANANRLTAAAKSLLPEKAPPEEVVAASAPGWPPAGTAQDDQAPGPRPAFPHPAYLKQLPNETLQAVLILGEGAQGNLFLLERGQGSWLEGATWMVAGGPYACRLGSGGLAHAKQDGDKTTPMGWTAPGQLYALRSPATTWPCTTLSIGDAWVIDPESEAYNRLRRAEGTALAAVDPGALPLATAADSLHLDIGYNPEGLVGLGAGVLLTVTRYALPTDGEIAVSHEVMRRVAAFLNPLKRPMVGVFGAGEEGWHLEEGMPEAFVFLSEVAPGIGEQARYATDDNFMGRPLEGYFGRRLVIRRELAQALLQVQEALAPQGYGLLVYDAYRPARAVADISRWLDDLRDTATAGRFYPELTKGKLRGTYLADPSPHSRGVSVDVTLCALEDGQPLDMGTEFDFFSPLSGQGAHGLSREQQANRALLREEMAKAGFAPYDLEWWHFNYTALWGREPLYDFIIPQ
ncbi:MAG: hypothetical protein GXX99_02350 [Clostridiales bacterium]|nr:hypothetical protein [Clostridiales bacterium]